MTYKDALENLVGFLDDLYFNTTLDHAQLMKCISESFNVVMFNFVDSLEEESKETGENKKYFSNPIYVDLSIEVSSLINKYREKNLQTVEIVYILTNVLKALTHVYNDKPVKNSSNSDDLFSIDINARESSEEDYSETLNNVIEKFKSL